MPIKFPFPGVPITIIYKWFRIVMFCLSRWALIMHCIDSIFYVFGAFFYCNETMFSIPKNLANSISVPLSPKLRTIRKNENSSHFPSTPLTVMRRPQPMGCTQLKITPQLCAYRSFGSASASKGNRNKNRFLGSLIASFNVST